MQRHTQAVRTFGITAVLMLAASCGSTGSESGVSTDGSTAVSDASSTTEESTSDGSANGDDLAGRTAAVQGAGWSDNVTITVVGDNFVFASDGLPSHEVLDQYLADGRDGKYLAGGADATPIEVEIPIVPVPTDTRTETGGGSIGVSISGAVFFDPYEGDGSGTAANDDNDVIDGVPFIDACGGHPLPTGQTYHYHGVPFCVTDAVDTAGEHSVIIGYLFDGYPIYGPQDTGGEEPTDLDECMGHTGPTPEFGSDTYHYHVSSEANYISECYAGEVTGRR